MRDLFESMGAIVLAGGKGERFRGQKQFVCLNGVPLWKIVRDKAEEVLGGQNIVVVGVDVTGGKTRTQSVINGMRALQPETTRVIILEAARPLVRPAQIRELLCAEEPSVSFVMPLVSTVIRRTGDYLNRDDLYELLTLQAFDYRRLMQALDSGRFTERRLMKNHVNLHAHTTALDRQKLEMKSHDVGGLADSFLCFRQSFEIIRHDLTSLLLPLRLRRSVL